MHASRVVVVAITLGRMARPAVFSAGNPLMLPVRMWVKYAANEPGYSWLHTASWILSCRSSVCLAPLASHAAYPWNMTSLSHGEMAAVGGGVGTGVGPVAMSKGKPFPGSS